jgi:hypothetical protein
MCRSLGGSEEGVYDYLAFARPIFRVPPPHIMAIWGIARALHRCRTEIIETPGPSAAKRDEERRIAAASLAHAQAWRACRSNASNIPRSMTTASSAARRS